MNTLLPPWLLNFYLIFIKIRSYSLIPISWITAVWYRSVVFTEQTKLVPCSMKSHKAILHPYRRLKIYLRFSVPKIINIVHSGTKFITHFSQLHLFHIPLASYLCVSTVWFDISLFLQFVSTSVILAWRNLARFGNIRRKKNVGHNLLEIFENITSVHFLRHSVRYISLLEPYLVCLMLCRHLHSSHDLNSIY